VFGAPDYPDSEWRRAVLWLIVAPVVGLTTQRLVQQVRDAARTDVLTGLPNRRAWDEALDADLARSRRSGEPVSLALVDLDHFKDYNDRHGHHRGDRLLADAAHAWRDDARLRHLLGRPGRVGPPRAFRRAGAKSGRCAVRRETDGSRPDRPGTARRRPGQRRRRLI